MRPLLAIALLLSGCANPMNAPAMPSRPLDAEERAIVEHTRDRQAALEMLAILHAAREMNFIDPVVAE
jgi:hypothetical protein